MQDALVNSDARGQAEPSLSAVNAAARRVARTQTKYHRWAKADRLTRFGDLFNLVHHPDYLLVAWDHVAHNKGARTAGVDGVTVRQILQRGEVGAFLAGIAESLKVGSYQPAPVRRVMIPKPGGKSRPLGIPTLTDRVVQQSLRMVLEPIFEADFLPVSYGFRPKRRAHDAVAEIHFYAGRGYRWVLDADIEGCFDNIDHQVVLDRVRQRIADKKTVAMVRAFLKSGVITELGESRGTYAGTPQGGIISPLLANIALSVLDEAVMAPWAPGGDQSTQSGRAKRRYHGLGNWRIIRYADDFVIMTNGSREDAGRLQERVTEVLAGIGLRLSPSKTRITHLSEGIDFLGFHIRWRQKRGSGKWYCATLIADKAFKTIKQTIRNLTPRRSPRRLAEVIREVNAALRGWTFYFRHAIAGRRFSFLMVLHLEKDRGLATRVAPLGMDQGQTMATTSRWDVADHLGRGRSALRSHESTHRVLPVSRNPHPESLRTPRCCLTASPSWRARCVERRMAGSAGGPGKRSDGNVATAPRADPTRCYADVGITAFMPT